MTDLALGLPAVHAARLRELSAAAEAAHAAAAAAEAAYTAALAELESFAQSMTAEIRASREADMVRRTVASELAVAVRESDRAVQARMFDAHTLVHGFPSVFALWAAGKVGRTHVGAVTRAGLHLPAEARAKFDARAAGICATQSTTRARQSLDAAAEHLHPRSSTERHRDARRLRRVDVVALGDGMSRLTADLPTVVAEGIHDRLEQMAAVWVDERAVARAKVRAADTAGGAKADGAAVPGGDAVPDGESVTKGDRALADDDRTRSEVRADTLADLLLTGAPDLDPTDHGDGHGELGAIRAHVQVVVAATTLAGVDEHPADLAGVGPVDADTARQLAGNAPGWDRVLSHPVTGQVLSCDRYTPTFDLRRHLRARDRHCRFLGCRVPAIRCEMDHTVDWAKGGTTCLTNLALLCQRHHTMKQFTPWKVNSAVTGSSNGPARPGGSTPTTRPHPSSPSDQQASHPPSDRMGPGRRVTAEPGRFGALPQRDAVAHPPLTP